MHYAEFPPHPSLAGIVRCIWALHVPAQAKHEDPVENVVPDGCMEWVIHLGDPVRAASTGSAFAMQDSTVVVGQITGPFQLQPTGDLNVIGVRFAPAAFASLFHVPARMLTDQHVSTDGLGSLPTGELMDRISQALDTTQRIGIIQQFLIDRLAGRPSHPPRALSHAVDRIISTQGQLPIDQLARTLRISHRHLERLFHEHVGVTPKMLSRIVRFRSVFDRVSDDPKWSSIALDCGYFDQAHLIRDFNRFAGQSPHAYLRSQSPLDRCVKGMD